MSETTRQKALIFMPGGHKGTPHPPPSTPTPPHSPLHNKKMSQIQTSKQLANSKKKCPKNKGMPQWPQPSCHNTELLARPMPPQWPATVPWGVPAQQAWQASGTHTATHHLRLAK